MSADASTSAPGLVWRWPWTRTSPVMISDRARSRLATRPRSTRILSSRSRATAPGLAQQGRDRADTRSDRRASSIVLSNRCSTVDAPAPRGRPPGLCQIARAFYSVLVAKGEETRQAILTRAFELAKTVGLSGLSIGRLAEDTGLSKSGLFAHFGSKEALEVAVVGEAARQFVELVVAPALRQPRGEPRVRALFERWILWGQQSGGCFFVGAVAELDDRAGPPRDALVQTCKDWVDALATAARITVSEGHFRADLDPEQFAFEVYSIMLGFHTYQKFLREPTSLDRARESL